MDLQNNYSTFQEKKAEVIGVAAQDAARAKSMEERTGASFPLLAWMELVSNHP